MTGELSGPVQEQPNLEVDCYSGYMADERPVRFRLEGRQYFICTLLDQWREPEGSFYRVRADDGRVYVLRQDSTPEASWGLVSSH